MTRNLPIAVLCLAAAGWMAPAGAQTVFRCGDTYTQQPCPGGTQVHTEDARSAGQQSQTTLAAQRDARMAAAMEKTRLKEESKAVPGYIPPPKEQDGGPDRGVAPSGKAAKPTQFTAVVPRKPGDTPVKKKKKKAKKAV